jgi:hypothetical protein
MTYRAPLDWLPAPSVRFDALVAHLSEQVLGRALSPRMLQAACEALALAPGATITASHAVMHWKFSLLLTTLLDSPDHMHR